MTAPVPAVEISAVMPAYNEEANLEQSVGRLVRDVNCAFRLTRSDLVAHMALHSEGALINTEMLVLARQLHARVIEVPVHHHPRRAGKQTGANIRVVIRAFAELLAFRAEMRKVERAA